MFDKKDYYYGGTSSDISFCKSKDCVCTECGRHLSNAPVGHPWLSVSDFGKNCIRYTASKRKQKFPCRSFCEECRKDVTYSVHQVDASAFFRSSGFEDELPTKFKEYAVTCDECGRPMYLPAVNDLNIELRERAYFSTPRIRCYKGQEAIVWYDSKKELFVIEVKEARTRDKYGAAFDVEVRLTDVSLEAAIEDFHRWVDAQDPTREEE